MEFYTSSFRVLKRDNRLDFYNNRPIKLGSIAIDSFIECFNRVIPFWGDEVDMSHERSYDVLGWYFSNRAGLHFIELSNNNTSYNVVRHGHTVLVVHRDLKEAFQYFIASLKENA